MSDILIDCDLCEIKCGNFYIKEKDGLKICSSCARNQEGEKSDIFSSIEDIVIKENIECPVCLDKKCSIQLPNCTHFCCISCFKKIYFGYTHILKPTEPPHYNDDPYLIMFPELNENYNCYILWADLYDNSEIEEERKDIINLRLPWMNTRKFLEWEKEKDDWEISELEYGIQIDEYYNSKYSKRNPCCPLCRK
jgi:hypothetical protein